MSLSSHGKQQMLGFSYCVRWLKSRAESVFFLLLSYLSLAQLSLLYALVFDVQVIPRGTSRAD